MKPRALGVDFGTRRIGIAVTDALGIGARPVEVVASTPRDAAADRVAELARELDAALLVFGMPVNMDGSAHDSETEVRAFARRCTERTGLPIEYVDERLTTIEAEKVMRRPGRRRGAGAAGVDSVAAAVILRDWLARQA